LFNSEKAKVESAFQAKEELLE
jgi:hypothetical protein